MSFGITELIIVLVIIILLFGTKKLRNLGNDLGVALKGFRGAIKDADELEKSAENKKNNVVIEGEIDDSKNK